MMAARRLQDQEPKQPQQSYQSFLCPGRANKEIRKMTTSGGINEANRFPGLMISSSVVQAVPSRFNFLGVKLC